MVSRQFTEEDVFNVARKLTDADAQAQYLEQICHENPALRARVEVLLRAHASEEFLASPPVEPAVTADQPLTEGPGTVIGPYKLREQVGEGGMGIVFVADQERPVRRKVALKVIKAGMDTKEVVARFSAERQALAMMDHPNIAKVFDAGCTTSQRPYFVMELVRGIPITEYCDKKKLTIEQRLRLFIQVCEAIQHAHQKGIIHRDIKPSNVMVTEHDGRPVPKVIDFGVAKATNQRLTEQTIYTRFQQIIGTPMYMSPEQAELSGLDVDTRSDVYALGVLLYELITGVPPFEKELFERATYDEIRRIIRDREPPTPSVRLTSLGDSAKTISRDRGTDLERLRRQIEGDLDWVVFKAMEKDRTRRYQSPTSLAEDVQRYLNDEIVEARSPSPLYRLRKYVRRNKAAVSTVAVVFAALTLGLGAALYGLRQARIKASAAEVAEEATKDTLKTLADVVDEEAMSAAMGGNSERTYKLLEIGRAAQLSPERLALIEATLALIKFEPDHAIELLEKLIDRHRQDPSVIGLLSVAHMWAGHDSEGLRYLEMLRGLTLTTADDYLFAGMAGIDRSRSWALIEEAVARKPSPGALAFRARAGYCMAIDLRDTKYAETALKDLYAVRCLLGDTAGALANELCCYHLLAKHAEVPQRELYAAKARETAEVLLQRGDKLANWINALYFADIDELGRAIEAWKRVDLQGRVLSPYVAAVLLRACDDPKQALAQFDELIPDEANLYSQLSRARLLAEIESRRHELVTLVGHIEKKLGTSPQQNYLALSMYVLTGDVEAQKRRATTLCKGDMSVYEYWGMGHALRFLAGECTDERIGEAEQAVAGTRFDECVLRAAIGERLLALGQRERAKVQFEKCIATDAWEFFEYNWAKAYLARMEKDPNWPHWVPVETP